MLPEYVLERTAEDLYSFDGCGIGVMELSHRSKQFDRILTRTEALIRELIGAPENYHVLFTTGGGTAQFSMVPMNLVRAGEQANYLLSGFWSERAAVEAKKFAPVHIAASSKDTGYRHVPRTVALSGNPAYLHFTSNNTIDGTQLFGEPDCPADVPLVCDASSDILSRPIDVTKYGLIYAAAQKNLGTAGVTIVLVRDDLAARAAENLPIMMNYRTYVENRSIYNTAPTFSIYITLRVLEWIRDQGGVSAMQKLAETRSKLLYDCIDRNPEYTGYVQREDRSQMNVTFHLRDDARTAEFIEKADARGLNGIAGYRTMGGMRVSIYNAFPVAGVEELVRFMDEFAGRRG